MDTTGLVNDSGPVGYPPAARGRILGAAGKPGVNVAAFTELVDVILPQGSTERHYGPCQWGAEHGVALPKAGAECVVLFDDQNQPTVVAWDGKQENVGPWTKIEGLIASLTEGNAQRPVFVRLEQGGAVARLRGQITAVAGKTVKAGKLLFVIPAGFRPITGTEVTMSNVIIGAGEAVESAVSISETGEVELDAGEITELKNLELDGITWAVK